MKSNKRHPIDEVASNHKYFATFMYIMIVRAIFRYDDVSSQKSHFVERYQDKWFDV